MMVQSAGFAIVDFSGKEPKVLCLLDSFYQWDFPKGRVEKGETTYDAAIRETAEECGLTIKDIKPSGIYVSTEPYNIPRGTKVSTYFLAERVSNTLVHLPINPQLGHAEHIDFAWFPVSRLREKLPRRLHRVVDQLVLWCESKSGFQV